MNKKQKNKREKAMRHGAPRPPISVPKRERRKKRLKGVELH